MTFPSEDVHFECKRYHSQHAHFGMLKLIESKEKLEKNDNRVVLHPRK